MVRWGWGREGGRYGSQLPTFDAESKNAKIPNSFYGGGGGDGAGNQLSTFDAESKSAKIPNPHFWGDGEGGKLGVSISNFWCRVQIC